MRYEKAENLIRLAMIMQGSGEGISLQDICEEFDVARRTAERMRDAVLHLFPQAYEVGSDDRIKRWKMPSRAVSSLIGTSEKELAALHTATKFMRDAGVDDTADLLRGLATKLKATTGRRPSSVEVDLEALVEAEGLAMRPGPRRQVDKLVLEPLREAIFDRMKVRLHYRAAGTGVLSRQIVCPYGFLYGNRNYLVAYSMNPEVRDYRLFVLGKIERVEALEEPFERQEDFSLESYAQQSFGVFQEDPVDVVWQFSADVADDAREYIFHPSQSFEDQKDGSLIVRFRAGGLTEMAWHLFTWGDEVEILEPKSLQDELDWWLGENEDDAEET